MRIALLIALLASAAHAQVAEALRARCAELRPTDDELALHRLDWAADVDEARARASRERRPVLLLTVRNISGGGNIRSGHC
jgi:hypothetical protein